MLTSSHGLIGYILFRKKGKKIWKWAVLGSVFPDIPMIFSLIVFFLYVVITGDKEITHEILHEQFIDRVLSPIVHSIFFWIGIFSFYFVFSEKRELGEKIKAFSIGGLLHIFVDLLTHRGEWTWNYFYPIHIAPIEGLFYYLNPYFIIIEHIIFIIIFLTLYLKNR